MTQKIFQYSKYYEFNNLYDCISLIEPTTKNINRALFLDRDGVVNVEKHYVHKIEDCEFVDGIFELCRNAKVNQYKIIIVTNQSGIAKGYYTENDYKVLMEYISKEFTKQNCSLDDVFYCPFHIEGIGKYKKDSEDRKPNIGMLTKAIDKYKLTPANSILIGDKESDILAGKRAKIGTLIKINNISN